jgi:hypothetical protein
VSVQSTIRFAPGSSHGLRRVGLLLAIAAAFLLLMVGGPAAQGAEPNPEPVAQTQGQEPEQSEPVALTPQPDEDAVTLSFGEGREMETLKVLLVAPSPLTEPPTVIASDFHTSDGVPFSGKLTPEATLADSRTVRVTVKVDPESAKSGDYSGRLLLHGAGIVDTDIAATVKLAAIGWSSTVAWIVAIVALGLGLAIGLAMKWLGDTGTKLQDLAARVDVVQAAVKGLKAVPAMALAQIREVREHIANGNVAKAELAFKSLEEHSSELVRVSWLLGSLEAELRRQEQLIGAAGGAWASRRGELAEIVHHEQEEIEELREHAWPDPASGNDARTTWANQVQGFSGFLARLSNPAFAAISGLDEVVSLYLNGEFDKAEEKWKVLTPDSTAAPGGSTEAMQLLAGGAALTRYLAEPPAEAVAATEAGPVKSSKSWIVEHAAMLLQVGLGIGLLVVGLVTVFDPDTMFHGSAGADILALFSWGFASGLTGATVADLAGKLTPASS